MAPFWQNARVFGNCRIQNRWINSYFYQFKSDLWCLDKDFCVAAFAYVYEIFTVKQLQFAVTKSNKKLTEHACGRFCFQSFYILYKVFMQACLFLLAQIYFWKFISITKNWPNLPINKIQVQFNKAKLYV